MTVWVVRGGKEGEQETAALSGSRTVIGWPEMTDLSEFTSREALRRRLETTYTGAPEARISNWLGQIWSFVREMRADDVVIMPLKSTSSVAIGRIVGEYEYLGRADPVNPHGRKVAWLGLDVPRDGLGADLLSKLNIPKTVFSVRLEGADKRLVALCDLQSSPAGDAPIVFLPPEPTAIADSFGELSSLAQDQISQFIRTRFREHRLATLIDGILVAQGFATEVSPPGKDGGVDIFAGRGNFGFDAPRLCVQVKSDEKPVGTPVVQQLTGAVRDFGADFGLLVSWSGFTADARRQAREKFFRIRFWDAGDVIRALTENYERLPADLKAEIPLKPTWVLVLDTE